MELLNTTLISEADIDLDVYGSQSSKIPCIQDAMGIRDPNHIAVARPHDLPPSASPISSLPLSTLPHSVAVDAEELSMAMLRKRSCGHEQPAPTHTPAPKPPRTILRSPDSSDTVS